MAACGRLVPARLCTGPLNPGETEFRGISDDQSIVTGYAIDCPETNYLPSEHWLAATLGRRLECLRTERPDVRLGPDGKVLVVCDPDDGNWSYSALPSSGPSAQTKLN